MKKEIDEIIEKYDGFGFAMWRIRIMKPSTQTKCESERKPSINFSDRHIAKPVLYAGTGNYYKN